MYIQELDAELTEWLSQFAQVAQLNFEYLGLPPGATENFNDAVSQLQAAIAAEENVRVVLDAAQHERRNAMIQVNDAVEGFCRLRIDSPLGFSEVDRMNGDGE